jgi:hypothetical protein
MSTNISDLIPFTDLGNRIPGCPTLSTLHRWRKDGRNGRRLNTVRIGGRRFASMAAVLDFMVVDDGGSPGGQIIAERPESTE